MKNLNPNKMIFFNINFIDPYKVATTTSSFFFFFFEPQLSGTEIEGAHMIP